MGPCSGHHDFSVELFFKKKPNPSRFWGEGGREKEGEEENWSWLVFEGGWIEWFISFVRFLWWKFLNSWYFLESLVPIFLEKKIACNYGSEEWRIFPHFCDNSFFQSTRFIVNFYGLNNFFLLRLIFINFLIFINLFY